MPQDVHVIYDEVAVGFGRTGSLFVSESLGLNPSFVCLSKGITSGYLPMAATLTTDEIYQAFYDEYESFKLFIHSHSYSANPFGLCCLQCDVGPVDQDRIYGRTESENRIDAGARLDPVRFALVR